MNLYEGINRKQDTSEHLYGCVESIEGGAQIEKKTDFTLFGSRRQLDRDAQNDSHDDVKRTGTESQIKLKQTSVCKIMGYEFPTGYINVDLQ